ncbi:MAG: CvpA family protein [Oscillospiraceae bacterium]|nr:CvpA family protein [Oscillospiraceae bacterium]
MSEPIQVDAGGRRSRGPKPIVIPPERAGLRVILSVIGAVITAGVAYYVMLPPLNLKAQEFYMYVALVFASFIAFLFLLSQANTKPEYMPFVKEKSIIPFIAVAVTALFFGVAWVVSSPFFNAVRYSEIMAVSEDADFAEDIHEANFASIPRLDEASAKAVAERTLGSLADYVSQFAISESNTMIYYNGKPVRVVGLGYADLIKWLTNTRDGLPGYVIVDMANEKSEFVRLDEKIRYTDAEHFNRLLKRHLRFQYPTYMFGTPNFEIDDDNNPYWIAPRMDKTIGLLGGEDLIGIVLVNAVTGECAEYNMDELRQGFALDANGEKIDLQWIDRVYSALLLTTQYNFHGKYAGGFWNSLLGQRGVKQATDGYAYIAKDDDVFMYTGVTSATSDRSIIGFLLVNQRTKRADFYQMEGAMESSAEEAAEGLVSAYKWQATFPLLVNISGQPTYFLSLKDDSKVVQSYSMINVAQYNRIKVVGKTLAECRSNYIDALRNNGLAITDMEPPPPDNTGNDNPPDGSPATGAISEIISGEVRNGNSIYYIQLAGSEVFYEISSAQTAGLALLKKGQTVTIDFTAGPAGEPQKASAVVWKQARVEVPVEPEE